MVDFTHRFNVERFVFVSTDKAVRPTNVMGEGGEIFILDMRTPIKIADMAHDLIRLSGFEPDEDIKICYNYKLNG